MAPDFAALRGLFPLLARKTYLNTGSYAALAEPVRQAIGQYVEDRLERGADWDHWVMKNEAVRALVARLIGADADEVAITGSASAGINALASSIDFSGPRNRVVISDFEFPTNAQIWYAQQRRGAEVVRVGRDGAGFIPTELFEPLIDERTAIVAVTQVCYLNGARLDIEAITRLAHARGARVMVDCYQAVGARHMEVRSLGVDFAAGGMLKYLLGTAGLGFLYCRAEHVAGLVPTTTGWFAQADIGAMDATRNDPSPTARRFEAGTPAVVNTYACEAGLELLLSVGTRAVEPRVEALSGLCLDRLEEIGWRAATPRDERRRGPTVAIPSCDPAGLVDALQERGIVTSWRDENIRASFHFYNNEADVDHLVTSLAALRDRFAPRPAA